MRKFFVDSNQITEKEIKIIGDDVNHIRNVLRLEIGEKLKIGNKDTSENYVCEIHDISKDGIICTIVEKTESVVEGNVELTVFQGLPKADKMELIIQKGTELGVHSFVPVEFKRSIVKLDGKDAVKKIERWQKIAEMASKQSGRDIIPKINNVQNIKNVCKLIDNYDIVLLAFENEENNLLKSELIKLKDTKEKYKIAIIIGPEGGIEDSEVQELKQFGAKVVTLGKRILRTETAPLNMVSIIMYELET